MEVLVETEVSAMEALPSSEEVDFVIFGTITRRKRQKETRHHLRTDTRRKHVGLFADQSVIHIIPQFDGVRALTPS